MMLDEGTMMLTDERIDELSEKGAKLMLRRAVEEIAGRMVCESCAMRLVCGTEATGDDCMSRVLTLLDVHDEAVRDVEEEEAEPEEKAEPKKKRGRPREHAPKIEE